MASVNYYLKKPQNKKNKSLIYLQFKYAGEKFVYSFGQKIHATNWNGKKQRAKNNKETTADGEHSINDLLDNLEKVCMKTYNDHLKNGYPPKKTLKDALDAFFVRNIQKEDEVVNDKTLFSLIDRFIAGEILHKGKEKSQGTLDNYYSVKKHLEAYAKDKKYRIDFDTITVDWFYSYVSYLKKTVGIKHNTIAKDIRILKAFMNKGVRLQWTNNLAFKDADFTIEEEDKDSVYLTNDEIISLYNFNFKHNRTLEEVRDLFVFGCFTGLRYSDYSNIRAENIIQVEGETFISLDTLKTGERVVIPVNPIVLKIFDKYAHNANRLPHSYENQPFNRYIKDVCKEAGFTAKGKLINEPDKELYHHISSHTARRSYATNTYLQGFPTIELMKITGHKTEKAFLKYIKVDKLTTAKRLSEHTKKYWSSLILKVA
jgi:integrase